MTICNCIGSAQIPTENTKCDKSHQTLLPAFNTGPLNYDKAVICLGDIYKLYPQRVH